ncbi:TonB C-terminal domain-containing protein [Entamoeba marina]
MDSLDTTPVLNDFNMLVNKFKVNRRFFNSPHGYQSNGLNKKIKNSVIKKPQSNTRSKVTFGDITNWKLTPYRLNGHRYYVVLLDGNGKFVRCFQPNDYFNAKTIKTTKKEQWMISFIEESNQQLYPVLVNDAEEIVSGARPLSL